LSKRSAPAEPPGLRVQSRGSPFLKQPSLRWVGNFAAGNEVYSTNTPICEFQLVLAGVSHCEARHCQARATVNNLATGRPLKARSAPARKKRTRNGFTSLGQLDTVENKLSCRPIIKPKSKSSNQASFSPGRLESHRLR
jgi:hypothetical protein